MKQPLEILYGVAKVVRLRILPAPDLRKIKPDALVRQVLPAACFARATSGDVSALLDRDGAYLAPKKALSGLMSSRIGQGSQVSQIAGVGPMALSPGEIGASTEGQVSVVGGSLSLSTVTAIRLGDMLPSAQGPEADCDAFAPPHAASLERERMGLPQPPRVISQQAARVFQAVEQADIPTLTALLPPLPSPQAQGSRRDKEEEEEEEEGGERGEGVGARHPVHGGTVLHVAAGLLTVPSQTQEAVVRLLLERGADLNARADNGATPLHWAAGNGCVGVLRVLLEGGADAHLSTYTWTTQVVGKGSGQTAAHWAAESGHADCLRLLSGYGPVSLVLRDERGAAPLDLALKELRFDCHDVLTAARDEEYVMIRVETVDRATRILDPAARPEDRDQESEAPTEAGQARPRPARIQGPSGPDHQEN